MTEKILKTIKQLRENSPKRNFCQSFDLIINLKEYDLKKQESKFTEDVVLPEGRGEEAKTILFSDSIKNVDCEVFNSGDIEKLSKNKREAKKLIKDTDFFLSEPKLMPLIGKALGQFLATRNKMPKIVTTDFQNIVKNYKKSVRIMVKDSPVIQCVVGKENMDDNSIAENIEAVLNFLNTKLPKGKKNIDKILLKLTMGKPMEIEV